MMRAVLAEIHMRKTLGGLEPCDGFSLPRMALGSVAKVQIRQPRNVMHHRKYWALLNKVFENQTYFMNVKHLHQAIKRRTGYAQEYKDRKGQTYLVYESTSFEKMDQTDFGTYYDAVVAFLIEEVIPGLEEGALLREIEEMIT
jgi:hypothetical protein